MELKKLINSLNSEIIELDDGDILLKDLLTDGKYNLLRKFLSEHNICTTNQLKSISQKEYNKLKMGIPSISGVGEEKTDLFITKIDSIRKYKNNIISSLNDVLKVKLLGKIQSSKNVYIEINHLSYSKNNEYIDIRQVKSDGTRGKGISIKLDNFEEFKNIINSVVIERIDDSCVSGAKEVQEQLSFVQTKSLKELILENEKLLLNEFSDEFGLSIKLFIKKIESFVNDGDIVKFLNNPSIDEIKKEQYTLIHDKGFKTALDIMDEYDKTNISSSSINDLKIGDNINTNTICALVNNFNAMLGMYYNSEEDYLILKCQLHDGGYNDVWIEKYKSMSYYLQNEKEIHYTTLNFSHVPNQICRDIILGKNKTTKVYLMYRYNKNEDYIFAGEFIPVGFLQANRCIMLQKKHEQLKWNMEND